MSQNVRFERSHDILIDAAPAAVLDYVSNPKSWPEWIAASHHIDSPDRPLLKGERFREQWATRTGEVTLDWLVTERVDGKIWEARTHAGFIGDIVVRYEVESVGDGCRYRRVVTNPARPKAPTEDMIRRIDEEAALALANIKREVEARRGRS